MEFSIAGGNSGAKIYIDNQRENNGICFFDLNLLLENEVIPEEVSLSFSIKDVDIYSVWSPSIGYDRSLGPNWSKRKTESRLASWMPLHGLVSSAGKNRMLVAVSDAHTPLSIATGV